MRIGKEAICNAALASAPPELDPPNTIQAMSHAGAATPPNGSLHLLKAPKSHQRPRLHAKSAFQTTKGRRQAAALLIL